MPPRVLQQEARGQLAYSQPLTSPQGPLQAPLQPPVKAPPSMQQPRWSTQQRWPPVKAPPA
eukprot:3070231-Lingulodinium_polyedra.AAC.1